MRKHPTAKLPQGFTLVELLIVVIILAILAAIVVPQFSSSTSDAKVSSLDSTLQGTRAILEVYYQQHGHYPSAVAATGGTCTGGTAGTGAINTEQAFLDQLSLYTNVSGQACNIKTGTFTYGPYLKKAELPANPITEVSTLLIKTDGLLGMTGEATAAGWKYDNVTGQFIANDTAYDDH